MDSARLRRATIALIAAYAVALQALLAAFAPAAQSAAPFAVLCSGDIANGHPAQHEWPCSTACAALGQGIGAPLPVDTTASAVSHAAAIAFVPASGWIAPATVRGPHAPRGPPIS